MGSLASAAVPQLWKALRARGWSQGDLAEAVGTTSSVVNRWLHGDRRPGRRYAGAIEEILKIDASLWDSPLSGRFELKPTGS